MTYLDLGAKSCQTLRIDTAINVGEDRTLDTRPAKIALDFSSVFECLVGYLSITWTRLDCSHAERSLIGLAEFKD